MLIASTWWQTALAAVLIPMMPPDAVDGRSGADVRALVALGARVTGTPATEQAAAYLSAQYREAGYITEVQTFTYPKFEDLGSSLSVAGERLTGRALSGSPAASPTALLVAVPGVGQPADFEKAGVRGAIVVVRRGQIPFLAKARNAAAAGAVGLVIVNTEPGELYGTLGGEVAIPVLALSGERGSPLLVDAEQAPTRVGLVVATRKRTITGRNVIAHLPGISRPDVLLGAHYDSVPDAPGANDNASGTAVVLELARRLAGTALADRVWFVAFDGEEDGLQGSRAFVNRAESTWVKGLKGMLNFDMVGVNDRLLVGGSGPLVAVAQAVDSTVSPFRDNGLSDHRSFTAQGVPALFFYRGQDPNYHKPGDTSVNPKLLDATTGVGLEVVRRLLATGKQDALAQPLVRSKSMLAGGALFSHHQVLLPGQSWNAGCSTPTWSWLQQPCAGA